MAPNLKRPRMNSLRSVSPPAVKRRTTDNSIGPSNKVEADLSYTRVFSWNVNGINPLLQKRISFDAESGFPLRSFLRRHNWPQFLCLQEVKISLKDEATQRRLLHAANAENRPDEPIYRIHFSLPRDKHNATGFGGKVHGVASLIREDYSDQVEITRVPAWDLEGRVLIHKLSKGVVIINGYWVNGTTNPYHNPTTGTVEGTRHDYKLRFHQHMLEEAMNFTQQGQHVVLVGDMNVARHRIDGHPNLRETPAQHVKNRADFNEKFFTDSEGLRAIDIFRQIHGQTKKYSYHPRGCKWGESCDRVDLIMVTDALYANGVVKATNICDNPQDRGHSDHVPLWVTLDFSRLPPRCLNPLQ